MFTYQCPTCEGSVFSYTVLNRRLIVRMFRVTPPQCSSSYIVKLTPSSFSLSLSSTLSVFILWSFHKASFIRHIVLGPAFYSGPALQLPLHEHDDWTISKELKILELISSQIFCLLSYLTVKKQMRWCWPLSFPRNQSLGSHSV